MKHFRPGLLESDDVLAAAPPLLIPFAFRVPIGLVDLRPWHVDSGDQGQTPSCAGHATGHFIRCTDWFLNDAYIALGTAGHEIYAAAKTLDGAPKADGTTLTAAVEGAKSLELLADGVTMYNVADPMQIMYSVHHSGSCLVGLNITDKWYKPAPQGGIADGGKSVGGHAVLVVGYYYVKGESDPRSWLIKNSWGTSYGIGGYCVLTHKEFMREFMYGVGIERRAGHTPGW